MSVQRVLLIFIITVNFVVYGLVNGEELGQSQYKTQSIEVASNKPGTAEDSLTVKPLETTSKKTDTAKLQGLKITYSENTDKSNGSLPSKPNDDVTEAGKTAENSEPTTIATPETEATNSSGATDSTSPSTPSTPTTESTTASSTVSSTLPSSSTTSEAVSTSEGKKNETASTGSEATETTTSSNTSTTKEEPKNSEVIETPKGEGMSSGIIALVMAIVFAVVVILVYVGLLLWRRYLEFRYGNRELLVNDLEFDTNDLRHFEL